MATHDVDSASRHAALFERERPRLVGLAYRMTGSRADGEDLVQDAWLRWRGADLETIATPGAYLTTVVTRLCLDYLKSARVRREVYKGPWLPEPIVEDASMDRAEALADSLSMAFMVMLERLAPLERAVFLLREVFDYSYAEIAEVVDKSEANCRQMVKRAKDHMKDGRARFAADRATAEGLIDRFLVACATGDGEALVSLFADDAVAYTDGGGKVKAALNPIRGADKIARFFLGLTRKYIDTDRGVEVITVNGQPGILVSIDGAPDSVMTFAVSDGRIAAVYSVRNPDKLRGIRRN